MQKFKADVGAVSGKDNITVNEENWLSNSPTINPTTQIAQTGLTDNNFFHMTCHKEPSLQQKIEAGEYVDLEKLLPKDKTHRPGDDTKLEWIFHEGGTYLVLATDRDQKISGIRKWDQTFRVYATICCGANPSRSKEFLAVCICYQYCCCLILLG